MFFFFNISCGFSLFDNPFTIIPSSDIDGLVDMKPICGTIVSRRKDRQGKEGKVSLVSKTKKLLLY